MKSSQTAEHRPIAEMVRGAQSVMSTLRSAVLLISSSPETWRPEKASSLGGVIVVPDGVTPKEIEIIRNRNLPFYVFSESDLPGPRVTLGQRAAAKKMTEQLLQAGHRRIALMTGYDGCLDVPKRLGIFVSLREAGIDTSTVPEVVVAGGESGVFHAARQLLDLKPRPTGVVTFDDTFGLMLSFHARRHAGLEIPRDLSIVSFHDWPYITYVEPTLSTVRFDFYGAGRQAAEVLTQSALTGKPSTDLLFEPIYRAGHTLTAPLNGA